MKSGFNPCNLYGYKFGKIGHYLRITYNPAMTLLIWILAILFLGFWTLLAWLSHKLLLWAGRLPWDQTLQQIKDLPVPAFVAPWWQQTVDVLAPLLHMTESVLGGAMQFAGAALPFIIGIIWLFGVFAIVALAAIVSGGIWWFKRNRQRRD